MMSATIPGKNRWTGAILTAMLVLTGGDPAPVRTSAAQPDKAKDVERRGPLAGLPSRPGPHIDKIKALGDNEWLELGAPAPDPKWGQGRGRSWGCNMPYAPDLQGAFLAGQGMHGFIKPDGRYDDIFFYDLNAHRWICIDPGLNTRTFAADIKEGRLTVNDDGQLVDRDGRPVIYACGGHSYASHTYDTDLRKYVSCGGGSGLGGDQYSLQMAWDREGKQLLQEQGKGKPDRVAGAPFSFNTLTGRFERLPAEGFRPQGAFPTLTYLPTRKALWHYTRSGDTGVVRLCDTATRKWSNANAKGPTPPGIDFGVCYDGKRDRLYVCGGSYRGPYAENEGKVYVYDVQSNSWSNAPDRGAVPSRFDSNDACVHYDSANDRVLTVVFRPQKRGVFVFDPAAAAWAEDPLPLPAKLQASRECWHGFYAPGLNAHFFFLAHDSRDGGTVWVYRFRKAAGK
jgi:hypothetical protein